MNNNKLLENFEKCKDIKIHDLSNFLRLHDYFWSGFFNQEVQTHKINSFKTKHKFAFSNFENFQISSFNSFLIALLKYQWVVQ